jgi:glycosyltransferase involved in cell wall biosynthesis
MATIHDLAPFSVPGKYDWKRMLYARWVVGRLARRQDLILAISETTARDITKFLKVDSHRVRVVYNGVDHARFHPRRGEGEQQRIQARFGGPFILYVSRLEHPAKNHVRLIKAFEFYKRSTGSPWKLVLAGSDWHGSEVIHQTADASPFRQDIVRPGFVADEEVPALYRSAEIMAYPSLFEGFGLPPIEAMACGCPVLTSGCGSLSEVVGDAAMIIDPHEPADAATKLQTLAASPMLRERLRQSGLRRAARFNWQTTARQTVEAYEYLRKVALNPVLTAG